MLAFFALMGLATAVAVPVMISSGSEDEAKKDTPEPEGPVTDGLVEEDPDAQPSPFDLLDEVNPLNPEDEEPPLSPLAPVAGDVADIPGRNLPDPDAIIPLVPVEPDLADNPGEDIDLPANQVLQSEEDPEPWIARILPLVKNLDDTVDEVEGPDDVAYIRDFMPGEDVLEITLFTGLPPDEVTVEVMASEDGQDSMLTANEQLIAVLRDVPDAELADFVLNIQAPLAS